MEIQNLRNVIRSEESVFVSESDESTMRGTMDQLELGLQHRHASAFGADERAGNVKPVLRKELIEVEAGDAAGNAGETRANEVCVLVADGLQLGVNLAAAATFANDAV